MAVPGVLVLHKHTLFYTESDEYETDESETEVEDDATVSKTESKSEPKSTSSFQSPSQKPVETEKPNTTTVRSPGAVSKAKVDFFSTPPEPLRLDPFKMFGMARKNPLPEPVEKKEEVKSPESEVEKIAVDQPEIDEITDNQVSCWHLTLSQTSPGFYVSVVNVFRKHCGKRRNCS